MIKMISSDLDSLSRHLALKFQTYEIPHNFKQNEKQILEYERPQFSYQTKNPLRYFENEIREPQYHHYSDWSRKREFDNVKNSINHHSVEPQSIHLEKRQSIEKSFYPIQNGQENFLSNSREMRNIITRERQNLFEEQERKQYLQSNDLSKQNYQINVQNEYDFNEEPAYYQKYRYEGTEDQEVYNFYEMGESWKSPKKDIRELYKNKPKYSN